eukprot:960110-Alexandrium_andersonii.AAC.1
MDCEWIVTDRRLQVVVKRSGLRIVSLLAAEATTRSSGTAGRSCSRCTSRCPACLTRRCACWSSGGRTARAAGCRTTPEHGQWA